MAVRRTEGEHSGTALSARVELFRVTRTAGAGNRAAGINMTASGNASNTTLDNLAAGAF